MQPTDAIVQVKLAGLCGSDLHLYTEREKGLDKGEEASLMINPTGTTMGHEFTGQIVEIGSEVKNFKLSDRVVSSFSTCCATCFYCSKKISARCEHSEGGKVYGWVHEGKGLQVFYVFAGLTQREAKQNM